MDVALVQEELLYDDFFSDPSDKGVEAHIQHRGHDLVFQLRKSLTLEERQRASDASLKVSLDKDGKPRIDRMDQAAFTREVVLAAIKGWPFRYPDHSLVPINKKTVAALDAALCDKLAAHVLGMEDQQEQARVPFAPPSGAAS